VADIASGVAVLAELLTIGLTGAMSFSLCARACLVCVRRAAALSESLSLSSENVTDASTSEMLA
jgi:hypothetical protein